MSRLNVIKWVRQGAKIGLRESIELVDETLDGFDKEGEPRFKGPRAEEAKNAYEAGLAWLHARVAR